MTTHPIKPTHDHKFLKLQNRQQMMTKSDVTAFLRAGAIGAATGGFPWMLFTVPIGFVGIADGEILGGMAAMLLPLIVAGIIVLASMVLVGLPLTMLLHAWDRECPRIYGVCGAIAGLLITLFVMAALFGPPGFTAAGRYLLPASGLLAGLATAVSWGRYRKRLRTEAREDAVPNPIHDLLH